MQFSCDEPATLSARPLILLRQHTFLHVPLPTPLPPLPSSPVSLPISRPFPPLLHLRPPASLLSPLTLPADPPPPRTPSHIPQHHLLFIEALFGRWRYSGTFTNAHEAKHKKEVSCAWRGSARTRGGGWFHVPLYNEKCEAPTCVGA